MIPRSKRPAGKKKKKTIVARGKKKAGKRQGYLDREAESVDERNRQTTTDEKMEKLGGVRKGRIQTPKDRAKESRGARKAASGTGKNEYGFNKKRTGRRKA
tara:strand:+ start:124 stop:426 length:303 start_codon:yes stop_codon:yes gene_type:complete